MLSGFINLYKTPDISSNKALSILKYRLKQNYISTKVGHLGTLDPIAEGVLPVALGRATRLFDMCLEKTKRYRAIFEFGKTTDTLDRTGAVVATGRSDVSKEEIERVVPLITGEVMQVPPDYSAKNVGGVRAYKLARSGKEFELPPKRVVINSVRVLKELDIGVFEFEIECGGGTYIRSIVRDLAEKLGTVGVMNGLVRTQSGDFCIDSAVKCDDIGGIYEHILPVDYVLGAYERIYLDNSEYSLLKNGVAAYRQECRFDKAAFYTPQGELMGIGSANDGKLLMKTWLL